MTRDAMFAEFDAPEKLVAAAHALRHHGYSNLDAYTPYPVAGLEQALGLSRSRLPMLVFPLGLAGAAGAYLLMWWCNAVSYPINVGARPGHAPLAFVPITFETTVLASGLAAFFLVSVLCRLPRLWSHEFTVDGFERASVDRFFLAVGGAPNQPSLDAAKLGEILAAFAPLRVVAEGGRE